MAKNDDVIEVEEDGVVTVDVDEEVTPAEKPGGGKAAAAGGAVVEGEEAEAAGAAAGTQQRSEVPRHRLDQQVVVDPDVAALNETVKKSEAARVAAEATAKAERDRRNAAERAVVAATQENQRLQEDSVGKELALITQGIEKAQSEVETAESELQRAMEAGDFKASATAQTKLSKAAAALDRLEAAKTSFEASREVNKGQTHEGRVDPVEPAVDPNPKETYLRQFTPTSEAWLRGHPDCMPPELGGKAEAHAAMMQGHWAAKGRNLVEGSADYYKAIEQHVEKSTLTPGATDVDEDAGGEGRVAPSPKPASPAPKPAGQQRRAAPASPSAPVTRDPPSGSTIPRNTRTVRLTPDQQEAARLSWPHLPQKEAYANYAKNLVELEAEGKMGRTSH